MPDSYLRRLVEYNGWANQGLLEFLRTMPPPVLDEHVPGVYGSIRETLEHMLSSELYYGRYLQRLGREGVERPVNPALEVLEAIAGEARAAMLPIAESLPPPEEFLHLRDGERSAGTVFVQFLMHSAEHRTHVCTILGTLGIQPPELDSWSHGSFVKGDEWPAEWGEKPEPLPPYPPPELS
jgi:uncharacterized damage-inducible protein DinB